MSSRRLSSHLTLVMVKERLSAATIGCDRQTLRPSRLTIESAERVDQLALLPCIPLLFLLLTSDISLLVNSRLWKE